MISFNLKCAAGHGFEGWFSSSEDYDRQLEQGYVSCPMCGDGHVSKALMTPNLGAKANSGIGQAPAGPPVAAQDKQAAAPQGAPAAPEPKAVAAAYTAMRALQKKVEKECDFVGDRFAEEARRIHYGEAEERGIYGRSTPEDAQALLEEGIEVAAMPWLPPDN